MVIDHIIPEAAGGRTLEQNLWLACHSCNEFKGAQTRARDPHTGQRVQLFNPRTQRWLEHFSWSDDGTQVVGLTSCGRATIMALKLNNDEIVLARGLWGSVGWWPPED